MSTQETSENKNSHLNEVQEKYRKPIKEIAEYLSCNLIVYFNPDTLEMDYIPKDHLFEMDFEAEDEETGSDEESLFSHLKWERYITIEPLESFESFKIMENFVDYLPENKHSAFLINALNGKKPFANFNYQIHQSIYRQDWFDFRQVELEKYVINNYFYEGSGLD